MKGRLMKLINTLIKRNEAVLSDLVQEKHDSDLLINHYGPITKLMNDQTISEIMINGYKSIFYEKSGKLFRFNKNFKNSEDLNKLVVKILIETDQHVSVTRPMMDGKLKDGSRVNVVLNPTAENGPIITIRKQNFTSFSIEGLYEANMFDDQVKALLMSLVKERRNIIICGGTGSGKTTLMNAMLSCVDKDRLIVVEDTREIDTKSDHTVYLTSNTLPDKAFSINIKDLVKNALRMRPDRLIIGEVRGKETFDMIQAMNTGHSGSMTTGHSNGALDMLYRLEMMILSEMNIPHDAIRHQIATAIDFVIYIERNQGIRRIKEIIAIKGIIEGVYNFEKSYYMA